jgi:hypothetical protein
MAVHIHISYVVLIVPDNCVQQSPIHIYVVRIVSDNCVQQSPIHIHVFLSYNLLNCIGRITIGPHVNIAASTDTAICARQALHTKSGPVN